MRNSRQRPAFILAQRTTVALVTLFLFVVVSPDVHAASKTWTNQTSSGTFQTSGNWNPASAPATGDDLSFINNFTYTINWIASATNKTATFTSGIVTQNFNATNSWAITGAAYTIGDTAGKTAAVVQTSGTLAMAGGSTLLQIGTLGVGTFTVQGGFVTGGTITLGGTSGHGSLIVSNGAEVLGSGSLFIGNANNDSLNSVLVSGTGSLLSNNNIRIAGFSGVAGAFSNQMVISDGGGVYTDGGTISSIGFHDASHIGSNNFVIIESGGSWTNNNALVIGGGVSSTVGGNGLIVTNGGIYAGIGTSGSLSIGGTASVASQSNFVLVAGTNSLLQLSSDLIVGNGNIGNSLIISNAAIGNVAGSVILGATAASTGNFATISGGSLFATNAAATGALNVLHGTFIMTNNAAVTVDTLYLTNGATSLFTFKGGTLNTKATYITNTFAFVIGDGTSAATLNLLGGTHNFNNGITNSVNATITGSGVVNSPFQVVNLGSIIATSTTAELRFTNSLTVGNSGTLGVTANATLTFGGTSGTALVTNSGTVAMSGGTFRSGNITNLASGLITGFGTFSNNIVNLGSVKATNGTLVVTIGLTNAATGNINISSSGTLSVTPAWVNAGGVTNNGGTLIGGNLTNLVGGLVGGTGTIAANLIDQGVLSATNGELRLTGLASGSGAYQAVAGASASTLTFAGGGSISALFNTNATIRLESIVTNTSIFVNEGTLAFAGGTYQSATKFTNAVFISGFGTISGGGAVNLSNSFLFASNGVLSAGLGAFTNGIGVTIGTLSTNATLNLQMPGGAAQPLINQGTLSFAGGTLLANGTSIGIITNTSTGVIIGVGNVTQTVANHGTIMAANPLAGLNVLSVGLSDFNDATLGASNGAVLNLVLSGGAGSSFNNNGTIAMLGGTLVISNGAPGVITNDLFVTGSGTITPAIVNVSSATILASNGVLTIGLFNNLNSGTLHNFDGGSSINLTNAVLVNGGSITLGGGGLIMTGVITNQNTITGPGALGASLVNDTTGTILATNGTLTIGTNTGAVVINRGVATISSSGVLSVTPAWLNTNGTIQLAGGVVSGGTLTNKGTITGFGTFSNTIYNATGGTITVASGNTLQIVPDWNNASGTVNLTGGALTGGSVTNLSLITGFGTISSRVVNNSSGILTASGGILTLSNAPAQNATFIVTNSGTLNVVAAWNNNGTVSLRGGTVIGGTLTNLNQVTGFGTITPLLVNGAGSTLTAAGGTLALALAPVQNGTIVITNGGTLDVASAWQNSGTVSLMGGTLIDGTLTNLNGARVLGYGTVAANLINSGTLLASSGSADLDLSGVTVFNQTNGVFGANNGRLIVDTMFTNAGTVSFINSVGTFDSAVVNKGAWVMNPSTNVFLANYTVATNGYISMASSAVSIYKSNFVNVSTLSNQYNTLNGKFVMGGQGTQQFFVAGINLGGFASTAQPSNETFFTTANGTFSTNAFAFGKSDAVFGYSNNFALGTLELSSLSTTVVMDAFGTVGTNDGLVAGLYLNTLTLDPGSLLIISNNVELYFQSTNGVTGVGLGVLGAGDNILILSGGSLHQIGVVPEPSVLILFALGAFIIHKYRRRS